MSVDILEELILKLSPDELSRIVGDQEKLAEKQAENPLLFYQPHVIQKKFHDSEAKERLFCGGNMSGKSVAGAKETVCYLLGRDDSGTTSKLYRTPPLHGWAGSPRTDMALAVSMKEIMMWMPRSAYDPNTYFDKRNLILHLKNGSTLTFRSYEMEITAWQGAAVDFAWMDEQTPQQHYMELRSRVNRRYGDIWTTMTPIYANSAWSYEELFLPWQTGETPRTMLECFISALDDNTFLTPDMIARQKAAFTGKLDEAARLRGEYLTLEGRIYPTYNPSVHYVEAEPILAMLREDSSPNGAHQFRYIRAIDAHQRAPDTCVWAAYNPYTYPPIVYIIGELSVPVMHATDFASLVLSESARFGHMEQSILDTGESDRETETGITIRSAMAAAGLAAMKPTKNFAFSRDIILDYIRAGSFFVLNTCPTVNRAFVLSIWDEWRGTRRFEDSPKERPKTSPLTHFTDCVRYIMATMPPITFGTLSKQSYEGKGGTRASFSHRNAPPEKPYNSLLHKNFSKPLKCR